MLRPAMSQIIREGESYYWADNNMPMEKKPVTAALEDFASGKVRVRDLVKIKDAN